MRKRHLTQGTVVQLDMNEVLNKAFAGCLMIVTEPKDWGAVGYVPTLGDDRDSRGGQAYYRAKWEEMDYVGHASWVRL